MSVVPVDPTQPPVGSRQLGVRVKPIIRLGMGFRDEQKRGAPTKTDYFTVRGDDRAISKFHAVKGEKPKSVEMILPASLDQALTIQYRAFKGADGDGSLVAVGATNYALRDYMGGPDMLTVWNQDGTVEEVETAGLDANTREPLDATAKDLGLELYTTLRAGMPEVLGFGSFFEISTKGKESTDNLWSKLRELYALFGLRVSFAVKPLLVMRPSTARPIVIKDGAAKRIKTQIYVLDVIVPESIDEMIERLRERQEILAPQGPATALYGPRALPVPEEWEQVEGEVVEDDNGARAPDTGSEAVDELGADSSAAATADAATADADAAAASETDTDPPQPGNGAPSLLAAGLVVVPKRAIRGKEDLLYAGQTVADVERQDGGPDWLDWVLSVTPSRWDPAFRAAVEVVVGARA